MILRVMVGGEGGREEGRGEGKRELEKGERGGIGKGGGRTDR